MDEIKTANEVETSDLVKFYEASEECDLIQQTITGHRQRKVAIEKQFQSMSKDYSTFVGRNVEHNYIGSLVPEKMGLLAPDIRKKLSEDGFTAEQVERIGKIYRSQRIELRFKVRRTAVKEEGTVGLGR